jgi:hypothetical protein
LLGISSRRAPPRANRKQQMVDAAKGSRQVSEAARSFPRRGREGGSEPSLGL